MPRRKRSEGTTSSSPLKDQTQDLVASTAPETSVQEKPKHRDERNTRMSEEATIMDFSEDISTTEAPEPLPVGEYPAEIRAAEIKTSAKGNRYCDVTFMISADEYPATYPAENAPDGTVLHYGRLPFEDSPRARFTIRKFCEAIGAPMAKRIDVGEWVGLSARVGVDHEEYEGINRARINKVMPV